MTVRPKVLGHRVLLKPLEGNEATEGGIVLPDEVRDKETRGMVVEVGERCGIPSCPCGHFSESLEPPVKIGDVVVYDETGGRWSSGKPAAIWIDREEQGVSEKLIIVEFADLLVVLEDVPSEVRS